MSVLRPVVLLALVLTALPAPPARAGQAPATPPPAADPAKPAPKPPVVTAGPEGFAVASADGAFKLGIGGYMQFDSRRFNGDEALLAVDSFLLRRVRLQFNGVLFKMVEFRVAPDFGDGKTQLMDAYIDVKFAKTASLRLGKFKPFLGVERLQSAPDLKFMERSLASNLTPNRDYGVALFGETARGVLTYAVGIHNGVVDASYADIDDNDGKDLAARLQVRPFFTTKTRSLQGLMAGLAWSHGTRHGTALSTGLATYRTPGQLPYFRFRTGVVAEGTVERLMPQFSWTTGPVSILAEHMTADYDVLRDTTSGSVRIQAWTVTGGVMLTGERATLGAVSPAKPAKRADGQWGAFEAVARIGAQTIGDAAFPVFADPAVSAREARSFGVGVNWYVNRHIKVMVDYDQTDFTGGGLAGGPGSGNDRPVEHALFSRLQLRF